ncbi:hypothetical protein M407DRAFT_107094 [Tulasnella calospora MUT 4182]|uniref:Uncharacterized protein n=1 Tax=Tulasnella calospora MUT 4182 TaxID=1051891 RepID=A0A0C3LL92_9AGAM|nr:hypothetical protein M407DRAFT_120696 [Tulasnella calospora MUT 4182]KIO23800.1 hypothetical protein M407DRAFT_107094 [Tulasnella calospora MUT 4182]
MIDSQREIRSRADLLNGKKFESDYPPFPLQPWVPPFGRCPLTSPCFRGYRYLCPSARVVIVRKGPRIQAIQCSCPLRSDGWKRIFKDDWSIS